MNRLLAEVRLPQPPESLWVDVAKWASQCGRSIYTRQQMLELQRSCVAGAYESLPFLATDIQMAFDVLRGLETRPASPWDGYVEAWERQIITDRMFSRGSFGQLRSLHETLGGILLASRARPFVLMIPQPDGTTIQMGWETVLHLQGCPIAQAGTDLPVLREHYRDSSAALPLRLEPDPA